MLTMLLLLTMLLVSAAGMRFSGAPTRAPTYPSPELSPIDVVEAQLAALAEGDDRRAFRFASPELKRRIGEKHRRSSGYIRDKFYLAPPHFDEIPGFAPLVGCEAFDVVGALSIDECAFHCTTRVVTADQSTLDVAWRIVRQPEVRPACYEDDPLQAGISTGPPGAGCWMVECVSRSRSCGLWVVTLPPCPCLHCRATNPDVARSTPPYAGLFVGMAAVVVAAEAAQAAAEMAVRALNGWCLWGLESCSAFDRSSMSFMLINTCGPGLAVL